jgi:hypothetical protein
MKFGGLNQETHQQNLFALRPTIPVLGLIVSKMDETIRTFRCLDWLSTRRSN